MKTVKKLMEDLGFNQKAPTSAKAAFIKHLAKAAYGVDVKIPPIYDAENVDHNVDAILKPAAPSVQLELPFESVDESGA